MLRCIREVSPRWIVGENVRGLTNWNGGMVFDEVQADLEANGYEVLPFLLPACAVNAPHRRDRIWFIANCNDQSSNFKPNNRSNRNSFEQIRQKQKARSVDGIHCNENATNSSNERRQQCGISGQISKEERISNGERSELGVSFETMGNGSKSNWQNFPTVSPVCNGDDGFSDRLDSITFPKWRNESIKAGGNAVVPQLVLQIFKAIQQYNDIAN